MVAVFHSAGLASKTVYGLIECPLIPGKIKVLNTKRAEEAQRGYRIFLVVKKISPLWAKIFLLVNNYSQGEHLKSSIQFREIS